MLSHVTVGTSDFAASHGFYTAVLGALGLMQKFSDADQGYAGWVAVDRDRPLFFLTRPFDGGPPAAGNGQMIALLAPDRPSVDRCHALALASGGTDEGPPGLRPQYHANYYGAYFRDPDRNKLCVCCHDPA